MWLVAERAKFTLIVMPVLYTILLVIVHLRGYYGYSSTTFISSLTITYFSFFILGSSQFFILYRGNPIGIQEWKKFNLIGLENVIKEFEFLNRYPLFVVPLLVVLIIIYSMTYTVNVNYGLATFLPLQLFLSIFLGVPPLSLLQDIIRTLLLGLGISVYIGLLRRQFYTWRRFDLARICINISLDKVDTAEQATHIIKGLKHYDEYIQNQTGLRINSIEKVYSKITATLKESAEPSEPICNRLAREFEDYHDKLAPLRYLARYMNIRKKENILIKESLVQRIQGWNAIVAAIIPALITVILSLLKVGGK